LLDRTRAIAQRLRARDPASYRTDIQGLRAVAVLLVALDHAGVSRLGGGYVGVDVFFVLSGFLITGLLIPAGNRGPVSLVDFYRRRARRILPAATLTLVVTDIVAFKLLNIVRAKQILSDSIFASLFSANIHFAAQGTNYFAQSQPPSPVQHFWSLAVEEQFYIVWPALLLLTLFGLGVVRIRKPSLRALRPTRATTEDQRMTPRRLRRLGIVVVALAGASVAWSIYYTHTNPTAAYFSTFTRAWELALGAALAVGAGAIGRLPGWLRVLLGWGGLAAIGIAAVTFTATTPFPGSAALLPTVGAALVIAAGIGAQRLRLGAQRLLGLKPLRYIGDRSYAFYLWHWPVLIIARQYEGHTLSVGTNLLLLVGAFALSIVSYALVENPLRRARWRPAWRALLLWPASILLVTLLAGVLINHIDVTETQLADAALPATPMFSPHAGATASASVAPVGADNDDADATAAVVGAVALVERDAPIPTGLTPPIGSLLTDRYSYPDACTTLNGQTSGGICRFGDVASTRTIALIGDSHSQMWMPALLPMASADHWAILPLGKSGCTPPKWIGPQQTAECNGWIMWALRQVRRLHPTVTLITGAFSGLGPSGQQASITSLSTATSEIKAFTKRVVIINDPPGQSMQPVDCLLASEATMSKCSYTPTQAQVTLSDEVESEAQVQGAGFINTWPWFCSADVCPMVIGHTIAYLDSGHVTDAYASQLATPFAQAFRAAAGSAGRT
jgi:peptidoglycan/LPS O-acetylase OafA/YrhL